MATVIKIYPPIGFARIGNSPDEFFIGPETLADPVVPAGGYKDSQGRIKRQAARFRLYAWEDDVFVGEITSAVAEISWTVQLANTKASWYDFIGVGVTEAPLRNSSVTDRASLNITPGPRTLTGPNQSATFENGEFMGTPVPLGNIQTDENGRLLVLGGYGNSASPTGSPLHTFANNDGWHDDVSDGPVTATVTLQGSSTPIQTVGAWVICPLPKYAPPITHIITLYDMMVQVAVNTLGYQVPATPSFTNDIYPILNRALNMKWISSKVGNAHAPLLAVIPPPGTLEQRQTVFNALRNPATPPSESVPYSMPAIWSETEGRGWVNFPLTDTQYQLMSDWVNGNFINDWIGPPVVSNAITPDSLTKAALQNTVGGPFFPGIETSYLTRDEYPYIEPFRLNWNVLSPGDLTKQNAVPWQCDFLDCSYEYPLLWWPAARPDDVFSASAAGQAPWAAGIETYYQMVSGWSQLGFLVNQNGQIVQVENS